MNIAIDATAILGPMSRNRGIGNYALSQFLKMMEMDQKNHYFFINFFADFSFQDYGARQERLTEFHLNCGTDLFLIQNNDYKSVIGDIIKKFIQQNHIDAYYITSPFDGHIYPYEKEWFDGIPLIATVYDIIPYVLKDIYLKDKNAFNWYMKCVEMLRGVDGLLVISQSVKDDLIQHLNFDADKITVIYGAPAQQFKRINVKNQGKTALLSKFQIKNEFIMCTGGDDGRKNIEGLIIAYGQMPKELIQKYQLVVVCKLSEHAVNLYTEVIQKNNVSERVILTNFVEDDALVMLYNLCTLVAFPSKYEGFGLPIVEAFACGKPVLTSNNSSLGEIAGNAAVLVDPFDTEDITRGLVEALTKADLQQLVQNGYERLKLFNWENVARTSIEAIERLKLTEQSDINKRREKIAFFTPLPPLESGISDYSFDMIMALSQYMDIDVYVDDGYKSACNFNNKVQILNHQKFKKNAKNYFDIVFQMGNSLFHTYMYDYIKDYGGTVVLHDYNLHQAAEAYAIYIRKRDFELYRKYLLEDYDKHIVSRYLNDLKRDKAKPRINEMELNGFIVNYARKIIVHSDEAKEKLLSGNIERNVRTIRSYAAIEALKDHEKIKAQYHYKKDEVVLASFGHIHETKRAIPILKAFLRLSEQYDHIKYIFVGKLDPGIDNEFTAFVAENKMEDKVVVTGFIPLETFVDYIDVADICLNLRYPYNGETSGSLMRILARGKCVILNDIGSFGEIPDDCCVKIPSVETLPQEREIDAIYKAIVSLISDEELRKKISACARKYAEEHLDMNEVAKNYYDFILERSNPSLSESVIQNIINFEIIPKQYTDKDIFQLSKTLSYAKEQ